MGHAYSATSGSGLAATVEPLLAAVSHRSQGVGERNTVRPDLKVLQVRRR